MLGIASICCWGVLESSFCRRVGGLNSKLLVVMVQNDHSSRGFRVDVIDLLMTKELGVACFVKPQRPHEPPCIITPS